MLSERLLNFTCFVVPYFDWGIFTGCSNLIINRMEDTSCYSCSMTHHLELVRLPWNGVTSGLLLILFTRNCSHFLAYVSVFLKFFFHILHINLVLLVDFLQLLVVTLQLHDLLLESWNWSPFSLKYIFQKWCWLCRVLEVAFVINAWLLAERSNGLFKFVFHEVLKNCEVYVIFLLGC